MSPFILAIILFAITYVLTPIGASANITGIGILRKEGYEVKAGDFMKISVPFTLTAVLSGYLFIWVFWGLL